MSEFFLELFSEEIPVNLQKNTREILLQNFKDFFEKENIVFSGKSFSFSTPNRVLILFNRLNKEVIKKSEEIRGPNINAPETALEGFLRSNNITKEKIFNKKTDKGEFYFYKKPEEKTNTFDLLEKNIPQIIDKISWKKSMKWGNFDLSWGRPLKSILAVFDNKTVEFLKQKSPDVIFVYSSKSAKNLFNLINKYSLLNVVTQSNLMCISEKVLLILKQIKWKKVFVFTPGEEEFLLNKIR